MIARRTRASRPDSGRGWLVAGLLVASTCLPCANLLPQAPSTRGTARLVSMQSLPPGAHAVVLRSKGAASGNSILLSDSASAMDLAMAMAVLQRLRDRDGESLQAPRRTVVSSIDRRQRLRSDRTKALELTLARLRVAAAVDLGPLGMRPSVIVALPTAPAPRPR